MTSCAKHQLSSASSRLRKRQSQVTVMLYTGIQRPNDIPETSSMASQTGQGMNGLNRYNPRPFPATLGKGPWLEFGKNMRHFGYFENFLEV